MIQPPRDERSYGAAKDERIAASRRRLHLVAKSGTALPGTSTRKERLLLLGAMAAVGPAVWLGHALLVWLKVF